MWFRNTFRTLCFIFHHCIDARTKRLCLFIRRLCCSFCWYWRFSMCVSCVSISSDSNRRIAIFADFIQVYFINFSTMYSQGPRVVCYLGSWANYRTGNGKFVVEDIDPFLCTHLMYAFAKVQNGKVASDDTYLDLKEKGGLGAYERFNKLREKNPQLKTLISVGGWNEGSRKFSALAKKSANRATFVQSAVDFVQKYNFSGLDLDWEYPAQRDGSSPADKANFVLLLKELRTEWVIS